MNSCKNPFYHQILNSSSLNQSWRLCQIWKFSLKAFMAVTTGFYFIKTLQFHTSALIEHTIKQLLWMKSENIQNQIRINPKCNNTNKNKGNVISTPFYSRKHLFNDFFTFGKKKQQSQPFLEENNFFIFYKNFPQGKCKLQLLNKQQLRFWQLVIKNGNIILSKSKHHYICT